MHFLPIVTWCALRTGALSTPINHLLSPIIKQLAKVHSLLLLLSKMGEFCIWFFFLFRSIWLPIYQIFEVINCKRLIWLQIQGASIIHHKKNEFWLFTISINKLLIKRVFSVYSLLSIHSKQFVWLKKSWAFEIRFS